MEMSLNDRLKSMPPGFRFNPSEETLLNHYLKGKMEGRDSEVDHVISEIDFCKYDAWDLPRLSPLESDQEWFFFSPLAYKYVKSARQNRKTKNGYWKPTGKDRKIKGRNGNVLGTMKNLVFHQGKYPDGVNTNWSMHEYHPSKNLSQQTVPRDLVLCRVKKNPDKQTLNKGGPTNNVPPASGNHEVEATVSEAVDLPGVIETPTGLAYYPHINAIHSSSLQARQSQQGPPFHHLQDASRFSIGYNAQQTWFGVSGEEEDAIKFADSIILDQPRSEGDGGGSTATGDLYIATVRRNETFNQVLDTSDLDYLCSTEEFNAHARPFEITSEAQNQQRLHRLKSTTSRSLQLQGSMLSDEEASDVTTRSSEDEPIDKSSVPASDQVEDPILESTRKLQNLHSRMCQSAGSHQKASFIVYETTSSRRESNPPLFYLVNFVVSVLLFIIILREMVIFGDW